MNLRPLRPSLRWALAPLALALVELFHPRIDPASPGGLDRLAAEAPWWIALHLAQLVLFPLTAYALVRLLHGAGGSVARVARAALAVFAVVYTAFDTFAGLATGTFVHAASGAAGPGFAAVERLVGALFQSPVNGALFLTGTAAWTAGAGATALALRREGAPAPAVLLLALSALTLWGDHPPPFGPLTFGAVFGAFVWLAWRSAPGPRSRVAA